MSTILFCFEDDYHKEVDRNEKNVSFYIKNDQKLNYWMSFRKFKSNCYCAGQKQYSGTENIFGEITFIKKIGREIKLLVGQCSLCKRKNIKNFEW